MNGLSHCGRPDMDISIYSIAISPHEAIPPQKNQSPVEFTAISVKTSDAEVGSNGRTIWRR